MNLFFNLKYRTKSRFWEKIVFVFDVTQTKYSFFVMKLCLCSESWKKQNEKMMILSQLIISWTNTWLDISKHFKKKILNFLNIKEYLLSDKEIYTLTKIVKVSCLHDIINDIFCFHVKANGDKILSVYRNMGSRGSSIILETHID